MSAPVPSTEAAFSTVAVVGVGLIGGSIGAAIKRHGVARTVIGVGRNRERLEAARRAGLIDRVGTDGSQVADAELVVVCTPVDRIAADVVALAPHVRGGTVFTDAGSVKQSICTSLRGGLPPGIGFIGSHPLAGSEKAGFEHADADLFVGRVCIVTPDDATPAGVRTRVRHFWERLGMQVAEMSPARHDAVLALTSHLPHAVAAALASLLDGPDTEFAASGFRDTTRIAAGDAELWAAIFCANREPLIEQLDRFELQVSKLRAAIAADDRERVIQLLHAAKQRRERL
ncbi:MAG: prephenate dehydrogenase/arogenate dehydrogenase family protein [Planctomycetaceae bacterium]|nr:prephenate dehydrogenase/arogenate dehydrogenase family protein [Planctomycetaceae bacterium]